MFFCFKWSPRFLQSHVTSLYTRRLLYYKLWVPRLTIRKLITKNKIKKRKSAERNLSNILIFKSQLLTGVSSQLPLRLFCLTPHFVSAVWKQFHGSLAYSRYVWFCERQNDKNDQCRHGRTGEKQPKHETVKYHSHHSPFAQNGVELLFGAMSFQIESQLAR